MPEQQTRLLAARYELVAPLGRGTMGTVWRAHDRLLGRDVAVKEIRHDPGLNKEQRAELRERMIREGRAAAKIAHPSVATVHDAILVDDSPWIIMELVEARSLEQVIEEEGPLPPRLVAEIGLDLLGALAAAHEQGILHRDVKPANVLLTETGRVVLTDFGIAKVEGDSSITKTGMVIGSPGYTAPERARGDHTGPESDLWSLGATLYFAVEGRPAYERRTVSETLSALMSEQADPATQAGPLRPVLEGMLEKDYTKRLSFDRTVAMLRTVARTPTSDSPATPGSPSQNTPSASRNTPSASAKPSSSRSTPAPSPKPTSSKAASASSKAASPNISPASRSTPGASPKPASSQAASSPSSPSASSKPASPPQSPSSPSTSGASPKPGPSQAASASPKPAGPSAPSSGAAENETPDEPDPNQTMVVIRPKAGLRIPPGPGAPRRDGAPEPEGTADAGLAGAGTGAGPQARGVEDDEDDQVTMVGLVPPVLGEPRAAGPEKSQDMRDMTASPASAPTRPPKPAPNTAPSRRLPPPGPSDVTPSSGFTAASEAPGFAPERPGFTRGPAPEGPGLTRGAASGAAHPSAGPAPAAGSRPYPGPVPGPASPPGRTSMAGQGSVAGAPPVPGPASGAPYAGGSGSPAVSRGMSDAEQGNADNGLGTDLFAFQGPATPRGNSPIGMIILVAVALLGLAAIVMLAAAALSDTRGPGAARTPTAPASAAEAAVSSVITAGGAPGAAPAPGLRRYVDASGYVVDLPERLRGAAKGRTVTFTADGDPRTARISRSPDSSSDILNTTRAAEARALAAGTYPGYKLIRLAVTRPTPYPGADVAEWEFTYTGASGPARVLSRWVAVPGGSTYAIYWSTPVSRWKGDRAQLTTVLASFRPARENAPSGS
ncbi:hypothetical protein Ssi03_39920 [Sphaerisporangium siamense]|uniref:non-specific serine/threonine protein kinase n=1 Tax=Sphaerisporangium siamense TaxID=795645 RepID=A0A7W7G7P8_9ACTN|nr:serine/threonine-protein kinase [Sphaerisporangium siamense]MBB4700853.1 serine/threonine protein kinase [Sphaerisporangium siamense]GII86002.1 hypothetical protein Ssi03_39920 [Sphaerisporangium siamense]